MFQLSSIWPFPVGMWCQIGPQQKIFKLGQVYGQGLSIGKEKNQCPKVSKMVVSSNECDIMIEGIECKALLDTGSCVSTLS